LSVVTSNVGIMFTNGLCLHEIADYMADRGTEFLLGDLASIPMYLYSSKRCIKYWISITRMPYNRYFKKCYLMIKL